MISRAVLIAFFLFINGVGYSQKLSANIDFARFKINDSISFVELYISIDANSVVFEKLENGEYQNQIHSSIKLSRDSNIYFFEKFNISSPKTEKKENNKFHFIFSKRVITQNKMFNCKIVLRDLFSEDTSHVITFDIDNQFKNTSLDFSDIQLLDSFEKSDEKSDFVKNGYQLNPATTNFYPSSISSLKYYIELYDIDKSIGENEPFAVFTTFRDERGKLLGKLGRFSKYTAKSSIPILNEINMTELPSGNYFLIVEARNKENKLIGFTKKHIQRANRVYEDKVKKDAITDAMQQHNFTQRIPLSRLNYYMKCLRPIATKQEYHSIETLLASGDSIQKRNYFFDFWYNRYQSNALKEWTRYKNNIAYVDQKFSCFKRPGYISEMGRITLKYGKPNKIDDEFTAHDRQVGTNSNEYQIWQYYTLNEQRDRLFVFTKSNGGNCDFQLIHSNVTGEHQNHEWLNNNNWRQKLRQNSDPFFRNGIEEENFQTDF